MSATQFSGLSNVELRQMDDICEEFEANPRNCNAGAIPKYLQRVQPGLRPALALELLTAEVELRQRSGEDPVEAEYFDLLADYSSVVRSVFSIQPKAARARPSDDTARVANTDTRDWFHRKAERDNSVESQLAELPAGIPRQFGRYMIQRVLGRGGMGSVYLAHDPQLDRDVALKVPEFHARLHGPDATERFYREARSMATLQHPNLCQVFDVGEFEGRPFLTMARIDGPTLAQRMKSDEPLDPSTALEILRKLALAVQCAHESGTVHRDIKPSNVIINKLGEPILTDFGLARRHGDGDTEITDTGTVVGSPQYMSPEQAEARHDLIGPRTDIYSLGVILYQMLCGRPPHEGSVYTVLGKVAVGVRPTAPSEVADVSTDVEAIILKAMAWDIESRYQTAQERG